jgi:hypothetical protein
MAEDLAADPQESMMADTMFDSLLDEVIPAEALLGGAPSASAPKPPTEVASCSNPYANYVPTPKWPSGANQGVGKVRYTHDAMIDLMIADPTISQNDLARHFGYTASWVSQIIASDAFQSRMAERREEIVDPTIRATVEERFKGIVHRSLEILAEKLNRPSEQIPDNLVIRTAELATRALGYGAKSEAPPTPAAEVHLHLENIGGGLIDLLRRRRATIDVEPIPTGAVSNG